MDINYITDLIARGHSVLDDAQALLDVEVSFAEVLTQQMGEYKESEGDEPTIADLAGRLRDIRQDLYALEIEMPVTGDSTLSIVE